MKNKDLIETTFQTRVGTIKTGKNAEIKDVLTYFEERRIVTEQSILYDPFNKNPFTIYPPETYFTQELICDSLKYKKQQKIDNIYRDMHFLQEELKKLEQDE